jgi:hypothetical protein
MSQHEYQRRSTCESDFSTLRQHLDALSLGPMQHNHRLYDLELLFCVVIPRDSDRTSHNSNRMSLLRSNIPTPNASQDSGQTIRLRSYPMTPVIHLMTPVIHSDSGRTIQLWSHLMTPVISHYFGLMSWLRSYVPSS